MAKIVEANDGDNKFPNPVIGKTPFLTSLRDFCVEDGVQYGVEMGVEKVSRVFPVKQDPSKAQMSVEVTIMSDMPKCRKYELDDDGEYVMMKDELTGKEAKKLILEPVSGDELISFPIFFPCGKPSEITNEADLTFYPSSSAYPLFKLALMEAGELPEDMGDKPFVSNQVELKEALEGFTFRGKCEEIKGKYNYVRLQAESL